MLPFNPGSIKSDLARHAPRLLVWVHNSMAAPTRHGALVELFTGFSPEVVTECERKGWCFVVPVGKIGATVEKVEEGIKHWASGKKLWDLCESMVKEYY